MVVYGRHRLVLVLVASVVVMAAALCLVHAHGDVLELCPPVLDVAGLALLGAFLSGSRFTFLLVVALPIITLDPTAPPPRA